MWSLTKTVRVTFSLFSLLNSTRAYCILCRSGEKWVRPPQPVFFRRHRSACLLTLKLPNCERKTSSVFLLPLLHLLRSIWWFFLIFEGFGSTAEMKSCPLPLFATLQPEILLLIESFKQWERRQNSSYRRASRVLDSCSWALVDPSSHLTPIHSVQVLIFTAFPFHHMRTHLLPFHSSVHTFASYYSPSGCVGRIH